MIFQFWFYIFLVQNPMDTGVQKDKTPNELFFTGVKYSIKGDNKNIGEFLQLTKRYPAHALAPLSLFITSWIYEKRGDYKAARVNYKKLDNYPLSKYRIPGQKRKVWIEKGLLSSNVQAMRQWDLLYYELKKDIKWEKKVKNHLNQYKNLFWNGKLQLLLSGWYLKYNEIDKAIKVLENLLDFKDKELNKVVIKTLLNLLVLKGDGKKLSKLCTEKHEDSEIVTLLKNGKIKADFLLKFKFLNKIIFFVFLSILIILLIPILLKYNKTKKTKYLSLCLFFAGLILLPVKQMIVPALILLPMGLMLLLMTFKKRGKLEWITAILFIVYIPFNALIFGGVFPWNRFL
jgi:hypothetical protein